MMHFSHIYYHVYTYAHGPLSRGIIHLWQKYWENAYYSILLRIAIKYDGLQGWSSQKYLSLSFDLSR